MGSREGACCSLPHQQEKRPSCSKEQREGTAESSLKGGSQEKGKEEDLRGIGEASGEKKKRAQRGSHLHVVRQKIRGFWGMTSKKPKEKRALLDQKNPKRARSLSRRTGLPKGRDR